MHTPETEEERSPENVVKALKKWNIKHATLIDNKLENWKRWQQQWWPTVYFIDKRGNVRYYWMGELEYNRAGGEAIMERFLGDLLREPYKPAPGEKQEKEEQEKKEAQKEERTEKKPE